MVLVVAAADADHAIRFLSEQGESVYRLGEIRQRALDEAQTLIV